MKYEEYITAIAPFEDFRSRANNCSDNKFKNKADAQYVINNPNFRYVLDTIFKSIKRRKDIL